MGISCIYTFHRSVCFFSDSSAVVIKYPNLVSQKSYLICCSSSTATLALQPTQLLLDNGYLGTPGGWWRWFLITLTGVCCKTSVTYGGCSPRKKVRTLIVACFFLEYLFHYFVLTNKIQYHWHHFLYKQFVEQVLIKLSLN